ncbi:MAG: cob(I)yrinic acid a,c-diamide adenosyltransferase [Planctomycetes bacterium]|nr:cob(I)yrinic acid a,c-diamide adenosyltransferase [Planctomycetota bacterium]MCB9868897.1 cob(I)yrinic acid a,c-diamide adenosyltransferase [Planctomycetota bacterium]
MPIYTGTGDRGQTGLFDNRRVPKDDLRIETYGTVDELNSWVGMVRAESPPAEIDAGLEQIQSTLFELGADLATPGSNASLPRVRAGIRDVEGWIDASEAQLPRLNSFVLPGGHREAASLHVLRTTARRAERLFWTLQRRENIAEELGVYLNRLSDLFFSWARLANHRHGVPDVPWRRADTADS